MTIKITFNEIKENIEKVRKAKPLVLCITNYVTMDFMANALLALGASPIMSVDSRELPELIDISNSLNVNIGTLNDEFVKNVTLACQYAKQTNKPITLDPVGSGATKIRTKLAKDLLEYCSIVKGNASEIKSLLEVNIVTRGVETTHQSIQALDAAKALSEHYNNIVVISGEDDFIIKNDQYEKLSFGSNLMPLVVGMGCSLAAVIAAFSAVNDDCFKAAKLATAYFTLCGNVAMEESKSPGSFRTSFIDQLYCGDFDKMQKYVK